MEKVVEEFKNQPEGTYLAILVDVQMPVMDSYEATRTIRALSRKDATLIPIYAMTADAFEEDRQRSLQAGMNGHLSKPLSPELLYQILAKVFNTKIQGVIDSETMEN